MEQIGIFFLFITLFILLAPISQRFKIPYPVTLVVGGLIIGFLTFVPDVEIAPDIIFFLFLPPMLFESSLNLSWRELKSMKRAVSFLAIGLVIFTAILIAGVTHALIPGFSWPLALVMGAILSPPDAVAATSVTEDLKLPPSLTSLLRAESLINDATALILFRYALKLVGGDAITVHEVGIDFIQLVGGGVIVGAIFGEIYSRLADFTAESPSVSTSLMLLAPFATYWSAEHLHTSAVLAVVVAGLWMQRRSKNDKLYKNRTTNRVFWHVLGFILNAAVFILMGMQLHPALNSLNEFSVADIALYTAVLSFSLIAIRLFWFFFIARMSGNEFEKMNLKANESWKYRLITSLSGFRGVVTLAAALSIPLTLADESAFPERGLILVLSFLVMLTTILLQGLTLPHVIKLLKLKPIEHEYDQKHLRLAVSDHMQKWVEKEMPGSDDEFKKILIARYALDSSKDHFRLLEAAIYEQRNFLHMLRERAQFEETDLRDIENELDIENLHLKHRFVAEEQSKGHDLSKPSL